ncbi:MAG: orotate phosphoribosyltransferase [Candidatus Omnitrophica bacterium]|nr:orotate phosphoribosyltransferase [Candidatus Omnitrophota bacterium]
MDIEQILEESRAILKGHFLLSSGLHSDTYFQMALVFQNPKYGEICSRMLAEKLKDFCFSAVIGPAIGGILLSYELGRILGIRSMFAERESGVMSLRRGFSLRENEPVLICEDVITTGGSVKEVIELVKQQEAVPKAIACLVQRGETNLDLPLFSLFQVRVHQYKVQECPLCQQNIPVTKPGSRELR